MPVGKFIVFRIKLITLKTSQEITSTEIYKVIEYYIFCNYSFRNTNSNYGMTCFIYEMSSSRLDNFVYQYIPYKLNNKIKNKKDC